MENPIASLADAMKIGDRIALNIFCDAEVKSSGQKTSGQKAAYMQTRRSKPLDRLRNQTETNDETEDAEASRRGVKNKNASKQTRRIHIGWIHNGRQVIEANGSQRDGEAALQGRGSGIRGLVGQLCGERRNVRERWPAS